MNFDHVKLFRNAFRVLRLQYADYSRKNPNYKMFFKTVAKIDSTIHDNHNPGLTPIPNWEILKPQGYRFFMPGNVGPGWHDVRSNPNSLPNDLDLSKTCFKYYARECPVLLRQSVSDLFPGVDFGYCNMTVVSLLYKNLKVVSDMNIETITTKFVLTSQFICKKLRNAGYWSDFINPLSGLPGVSTYTHHEDLYGTDPRFRSTGFRINEQQNCLVIEEKKSFQFRGNIFTTAPVHSDVVQEFLCVSYA